MAANAPTILYPSSDTGIREDRLIVRKDEYSGGGTGQVEWQIQIATAGTFAADEMVHDTGLRAPDSGGSAGHVNADDWWQLFPALMNSGDGLQAGTQYHMRARVRNDEPATSSWSSTVTFTMATADLTSAEWQEAG